MDLIQTRLTFFGLNPNDVATFVVVLMLSLPILVTWSRFCRWLVWPAEAGLLSVLVGTGSRGAVLALVCASVATLVLFRRNPPLWNRNIWPLIALVILVGVGTGLTAYPKGSRLGSLDFSREASAGRRLEVWSTVPAMMASAPYGWGEGNAAEGYEEWFEPVGELVPLKHLLSSHLTWLVEFGWPLRWLYFLGWIVAFVALLPSRRFSFPVWGIAVWLAFFVALFYNASGKWWNWPLPTVWLIAALILRIKENAFPSPKSLLTAVTISGLLAVIPLLPLLSGSRESIRSLDAGNIVRIGLGKPLVALLGPNKEVFGNFYGQDIRHQWPALDDNRRAVIVIGKPDTEAVAYLEDCRVYIVSGASEEDFSAWSQAFKPKTGSTLLLMNCRVRPNNWIRAFHHIIYCRGEFYGDPYYNDWKNLSTNYKIVLQDIPGDGSYVKDWLSFVEAADKPYTGVSKGI